MKSYLLTKEVQDTIANTLCAERLSLRLTHVEMAQKLTIGPKILEKLERREVKRIQSEDIEALRIYFGKRLGIEKVWASNP